MVMHKKGNEAGWVQDETACIAKHGAPLVESESGFEHETVAMTPREVRTLMQERGHTIPPDLPTFELLVFTEGTLEISE